MKIGIVLLLLTLTVGVGVWYLFIMRHNELIVIDQPATEFFTISEARLTKPGFIFIVEADQYHKPSKNWSVNPEYLLARDYSAIRLTRTTEDDKTKPSYFAIMYEDTDRNASLSKNDRLAKDLFGKDLVVPFRVIRK